MSTCLDQAEHAIDEVWRFCVEQGLPFKFLRSRNAHLVTNLKYADRGSSGKLPEARG